MNRSDDLGPPDFVVYVPRTSNMFAHLFLGGSHDQESASVMKLYDNVWLCTTKLRSRDRWCSCSRYYILRKDPS